MAKDAETGGGRGRTLVRRHGALLAFALTSTTFREAQRRSQRPLRTSARAVVRSAALLRWAHDELNFECDESTFAQVARTGDMTMLAQLRGGGVPCDARSCAAAAAGGHLDALQGLRAADCRWDVQTMIEAAEAGDCEEALERDEPLQVRSLVAAEAVDREAGQPRR